MIDRNAWAPARPARRTLAASAGTAAKTAARTAALATGLAAALGLALASPAVAQPKRAPAKRAEPAQQAAPPQQQVHLIYSPWTKFCLKSKPPNPKQVCFTGKDARIESGMPVVAAVLIEPQGSPKKILRVTLPLGMELIHGTRVIIDQNTPMTAPYVICFTNGCMSDYEVTPQTIDEMKKGHGLVVQAINASGEPLSIVLPLTDFAKAYDGPPTDPKVFEAQQQKLQQELEKRAEEARKQLEAQHAGGGKVQ